ncbi:DUF4097 domain-containing protein [Staphylococcus sp. SQ8-PEA]|uniref:DUF4097 domain-containing protein n=1 Tax=Staphylococcus marylandisciuri TaxID=2981529 RepID=A0ABT2QQS2_9STAP|nr:DUF4097 domain-containing protein [Staphylococcus marylandisciuri]MCU5746300.1 DUF4097 domain-containing protein [Staphylococcus marylandisciuri]
MKKTLSIIFIIGFILAVVFGFLTFKEMRTEAKKNTITTMVNKDIKDNIHNLKIDAHSAEVKVKRGDKLHVKMRGPKDKVTNKAETTGDTLNITSKLKKKIISFNVFSNDKNKIIITLPKKLKKLEIQNGSIDISGVKAERSILNVNSEDLDVDGSDLGELTGKCDSGEINFRNSKFTRTNLSNDSGEINVSNTPTDIPMNLNNDSGEINLSYDEKLRNTQIKNNSTDDSGEINISKSELKHHQIGSGDNIISINNDSGEINIT